MKKINVALTSISTLLLHLMSFQSFARADETLFPSRLEGSGRACSGRIYIRDHTIEWNSTFSICKPSRYETLEKNINPAHPRIVYHIKKLSKKCLYEVIELERPSSDQHSFWYATGYQSIEGFKQKDNPKWQSPDLPEKILEKRNTISCPMYIPD